MQEICFEQTMAKPMNKLQQECAKTRVLSRCTGRNVTKVRIAEALCSFARAVPLPMQDVSRAVPMMPLPHEFVYKIEATGEDAPIPATLMKELRERERKGVNIIRFFRGKHNKLYKLEIINERRGNEIVRSRKLKHINKGGGHTEYMLKRSDEFFFLRPSRIITVKVPGLKSGRYRNGYRLSILENETVEQSIARFFSNSPIKDWKLYDGNDRVVDKSTLSKHKTYHLFPPGLTPINYYENPNTYATIINGYDLPT